jgi:hypothetical protein
MKLTQNSKNLMSFFIKQNFLKTSEALTSLTHNILKKFYKEIDKCNNIIEKYIQINGYRLIIEKINNISEIPKPKLFNSSSFTEEIRKNINDKSQFCFSYTFSLLNKEINIKFIVEDVNIEPLIIVYNDYVKKILVWLCFINNYTTQKCSNILTIYIYFTSLKKNLPESNIHILEEKNINTAFTYTCIKDYSEIVIFRKEEWFKVLMHETIHNFGLDFSDINYKEVDKKIFNIFPVSSRGNSFEAYTEFWAEILNLSFCSYFILSKFEKNREKEFIKNFDFFIQFEKIFGIFQMVKALQFMGLKYEDLYSNDQKSKILRTTFYKEKTNVLSYYVTRVILLNEFQGFLKWCSNNNNSLIQFKKNNQNMTHFFEFIEKNYKKKKLIQSVNQMENAISNDKKNKKKSMNKKEIEFIENNMRMTICELG